MQRHALPCVSMGCMVRCLFALDRRVWHTLSWTQEINLKYANDEVRRLEELRKFAESQTYAAKLLGFEGGLASSVLQVRAEGALAEFLGRAMALWRSRLLALSAVFCAPRAGFSTSPGLRISPRVALHAKRSSDAKETSRPAKGFGEPAVSKPPALPKLLAPPKGCRSVLVNGNDGSSWQVLIGKTAADNDRLSLEHGQPHEVWMHAASVPGSHVVVRATQPGKDPPPRDVVEAAASLCAHYSKAKQVYVEVHITVCGKVSKLPGAPPGQVLLQRGWTSVKVRRRSPEELKTSR
ncbi:unnamed protein product [Effrenium voratum]|nr:unnamed protein product [Effrenium voratum]